MRGQHRAQAVFLLTLIQKQGQIALARHAHCLGKGDALPYLGHAATAALLCGFPCDLAPALDLLLQRFSVRTRHAACAHVGYDPARAELDRLLDDEIHLIALGQRHI